MREIKFRAWDKVNKKWVDPKIVDLWGIFVLANKESLTHEMSQNTGLLDRNGKEIYEGDVLKSSMVGQTIPVRWYGESAGFNLAWMKGHDIEVVGNIYEGG